MIASIESTSETQGLQQQSRWLLLFHQLPPKPDYLRVKVRRRLGRLGAVALRNSVYVLPLAAETLEDFQWLRREIVDAGGEATLCGAAFIEGHQDAEVEELFRGARDEEYAEVAEAARALGERPGDHVVERLSRRLKQVTRRDYFGSIQRGAAETALAESAARASDRESLGPAATVSRPTGSVWVTRQGVYVDRIASAWLIHRFIDPAARFKFEPAEHYEPLPGEIRFDMFGGEFTHEGDRCTFETLLVRFDLLDQGLAATAEIVHDIDCKDDKFGREETEGIRSVIEGIALSHRDDESRLLAGRVLFDSLYEQFLRRR